MKRLIVNLATAGLLTVVAALSIDAQPATTHARVRVNINTATPAQLAYLPGVGPATAVAIVQARPFRAPGDLMRVRGIKSARFAKMAPYVVVSGQSAAAGKVHTVKVGGGK